MSLLVDHALLDPVTWIFATARMLLRAFMVFFMGAIIVYAILELGGARGIFAGHGAARRSVRARYCDHFAA